MQVNPYPFQTEIVDEMIKRSGVVNNSSAGTGKTAMTILLLEKLNSKRNLLVMPKSVIRQFEAEIYRFKPELKPILITGSPKVRKSLYRSILSLQEYTILTTYEQMRIDSLLLAEIRSGFEVWVFDEIHRLNSTTTKTHKEIRKLLKYYDQQGIARPKIYGNTATLICNSPLDLFGIYNILQSQLFPNFMFFTNQYMYRHPTFGYILGARTSKLPELGLKVKPYIVGKTLAEVAPQMPPHVDQVIGYDLSPKESKLYADIRAELLLDILPKDIDLIKNPISLQNALVKMCKLQELTDSPDLLGHSEIPSTKFAILQEKLAEILIGNDRKCVVFSRFSRTINMLETLLKEYNPVKIIGDVTGEDRQANILKFKTNKTCRILLCTTAGSEGISLEEASYLIRLNVPFSIGRDIQLTGRIRRITSEEPTFSYTLCAKNSVDEKMLKILAKKKLINQTVFTLSDIEELLQS